MICVIISAKTAWRVARCAQLSSTWMPYATKPGDVVDVVWIRSTEPIFNSMDPLAIPLTPAFALEIMTNLRWTRCSWRRFSGSCKAIGQLLK